MAIELSSQEVPVDKKVEQKEGFEPILEKKLESEAETLKETKKLNAGSPVGVVQDEILHDEELIEIKGILSEDILGLFKQMSSLRQQVFRRRGEDIAIKIKLTMQKTRVKASDIFELIKNWLKMIPRLSLYFLEQEAKIKTDKILGLKKDGQAIEK
ncbi:MAG: hypothetical protein COU51_02110 [Parcubacteria group bacterium CG10_big_fil_rev_8_21_14_0_10_36_14]|nr:MAG: hypothetical protein COU51_02110 [Parcubacteria group bacterium CG10_big_fil_rev_8_21_14_0_10_36_14]